MSGVDLLPDWPTSGDSEAAFNAKADALGPALATMITQINTALGVTNISAWVSGAAYTAGSSVVWSPIDFRAYRRKTTSSAGTTDPSIDTTNWAPVYQLGNYVFGPLNTNTTLAAANAGTCYDWHGIANGVVTLPLVAALTAGAAYRFQNISAYTLTVQAQGGDGFYQGSTNVASIVLGPGDCLEVIHDGTKWICIGGSGGLKGASVFGASLAASGYQKLPSGMIMQWVSGNISVIASTTVSASVSFPIAFPSSCDSIIAMAITNSPQSYEVATASPALANVSLYAYSASTLSLPYKIIAVGR